ncbi:serine hydrolase domain-containing protein [Chryseobacterium paridis]|uniref:Beta-lactamase family protein n=1 Tax=Chryseobacterium paridis TaxID=2800328 RepID=A0ABS1FUL6_9FLAO|nr:serine hydrolase domain-containing protein [Chryseobacterium paridis]MBK1896115.1 beta-lactamase family protein [Chryseobacterium paridis]
MRSAYSIPEVSYAVITDKDIKEISATGFHSAILPEPATLEDRFHIGSNTKALTAFIIAKYVEKGKLKWNDQFFTLFPEWKKDARKEYAHITLEELLSHRALIQPFQGENDPAIPDFKGNKQEKRESFGKFVLTLDPVKADPEHPFVYSNAGYTLATLMLEKVTHQSWEQLVDKVFNKDLHLDVQFSWPDNQTKKDTWGHSFENGKLTPIASNTDYKLDYTEPSGDLNIRLKDYIKFIQLNLLGLEGKNNYLKSSTYNYIHNHFPGYSFGWFTVLENNINWSTHSGTAGTYYSMVQIDKTHSLAYIVFTNSFNEDTVNGVRLMIRKLKSTYGK